MFFFQNKASGQALITLGISVAILGIIFGGFKLFGLVTIKAFPIGVLLLLIGFAISRSILAPTSKFSCFIVLITLLTSDIPIRKTSFFQDNLWPIILVIGAILWAGLLVYENRKRTPKCTEYTILALMAITILCGLSSFLVEASNRLIFSDDYPSFLYRLMQLKDHFPQIPFYNPEWNGGVEAREFFPSGILNVFFLWFPVVISTDLTVSLTYIVGITIFIFVPLCIFVSARLVDLDKGACAVATILAIFLSLEWYRWSLLYGTLPFVISMALFPLNVSLCFNATQNPTGFGIWHGILFFVSMSLMCLWSPTILCISPLVAYVLLRRSTWKQNRIFAATTIVLLVCHIPWIYIFLETSRVGSLVLSKAGETSGTAGYSLPSLAAGKFFESWLKLFRDFTRDLNPFLIVFSIPSLFTCFLVRSWAFKLPLLTVFFLATFGPLLKSQLELQRFYIAVTLLLVLPVSDFIWNRILNANEFKLKPTHALLTVITGAIFFYAPIWVWNVSSNKTIVQFPFEKPILRALASKIKGHSFGGRVMFAGFLLHEIGGGHAAILPRLCQTPLVASRYQHDRWEYTDIVPEEYRKRGEGGIEEYLNQMNVSLVVTHDRFWRQWYSKRPHLYRREWSEENFVSFSRVNYKPTYFLNGNGEILSQDKGLIKVRINSSDAVIKFHYYPFLSSDTCKISPFNISSTIQFIKIENCPPDKIVTIKAKGPFSRLF